MNHFTTTMLAFGTMLAALPAARAADTICPQNLSNATVNGNLIVPAGQSCTLVGVTVTGNVQVQTNAALILDVPVPASTIVGNVSVGTGAHVDARSGGLTIDGNVVANQCNLCNLRTTPLAAMSKFRAALEQTTFRRGKSPVISPVTALANAVWVSAT